MHPRPVLAEDLPLLAADAVRYQTDPATLCCYLGGSEEAILEELTLVESPYVSALLGSRGSVHGWLVGELDVEIGRVWWLGPFAQSEVDADVMYEFARAQLPPGIGQEELAADVSNAIYADFAHRHGFTADPASVALTRPIELPIPQVRSSAVIRRFTEGDRTDVITLHDAVFPAGHYTGVGLVDRAPHQVFVAEIDGSVRGYLALERQADGSAYIDFLGVDAMHRRSGLATDLIISACKWARSEAASHMHLTVRETLTGARALYESLGFGADLTLVPYRKGFTIEES